jgi:hypothetical protein
MLAIGKVKRPKPLWLHHYREEAGHASFFVLLVR